VYEVVLGTNVTNNTRYFDGQMDEIRFWNIAKSSAQILAQKDCALNGAQNGLVAYYNFDHGIAASNNAGVTTLVDRTGNGNDGTLVNFALNGTSSNWLADTPVNEGCESTTDCEEDTTPPIARVKNITLELDENGQAFLTASDLDDGSSDNCGITNLSISTTEFGCNTATFALALDGEDDHVQMPNDIVSGLTNFTFETWINYEESDTWARVFDIGINNQIYMFLTTKGGRDGNPGNPKFAISLSGISAEQFINSDIPMPTGWHHIALTLNGTEGIMYIDGEEVGRNSEMTLTPADLGETTQNFLGRSQFTFDPYLKRNLDETRIWSTTRTPSQIASFKDKALDGDDFGLFLYYDYEDGPGSNTVKDKSPSQNDGTLVNMDVDNAFVSSEVLNALGVGEHEITLTVGDEAGNTSSDVATVTVIDNIIPTVECRSASIEIGADQTATISIEDLIEMAEDNCGIADISLSTATFSCENVGENEVIVTVTDINGNINTCTTTVEVTPSEDCEVSSNNCDVVWQLHHGQGAGIFVPGPNDPSIREILNELTGGRQAVHGDPGGFQYATIPPANDAGWEAAPIDEDGDLCWRLDRSRLTAGFEALDFTYFQTSIFVEDASIPFILRFYQVEVWK
ncbi:MAG: LamG-like jellyroll fold domain-containing protein, partial [Bacteroidota bacterium]